MGSSKHCLYLQNKDRTKSFLPCSWCAVLHYGSHPSSRAERCMPSVQARRTAPCAGLPQGQCHHQQHQSHDGPYSTTFADLCLLLTLPQAPHGLLQRGSGITNQASLTAFLKLHYARHHPPPTFHSPSRHSLCQASRSESLQRKSLRQGPLPKT